LATETGGSVLIRYFDAGALAKRYLQEAGSASVRRQLKIGGIAASRLSVIEM
jgi:hypothetical protein